jgi:peptide/nickel transport system substrate-binding protein
MGRNWYGITAGRTSRRQVLGAVAAGGAGLALLSACGSTRKSGGAASNAGGQAGKPRYGGMLHAPIKNDEFDFDPSGKATSNRQTPSQVFNSLLHMKDGPGVSYDSLILEAALAQRWEVPDAQTYIFHLQPGVKWQNVPPVNGRPLVSADVKWSLEYLSRTGDFLKGKKVAPSQFAALYEGMTGVDTPDGATATVRFGAPFAPFLNYAASGFNPVVAHEVFEQDGNLSKTAVGTGPFIQDMADTQKGSV